MPVSRSPPVDAWPARASLAVGPRAIDDWATGRYQVDMKPRPIHYLAGSPEEFRARADVLKAQGKLIPMLAARYPEAHDVPDNAALYRYVQDMKKTYMRSSPPLGKVRYCDKISTVHNALGLHTYAVRVQGNRLKRKNELRVGGLFRQLPATFLYMIVAHELAHLRHKDHDRAFYRLCHHIDPDYQRHEVDLRLWLHGLKK